MPWGEVVPPEVVEQAILRVRPKLLAIVQGDTSTTMCQPLADIGEICRRHDVLLYCDATASLGGNPFEADAWGVDVATAGLQKCLGGPSGSAPVTLSPRAVAVVEARAHVEAGLRTEGDTDRGTRIASNYLDLGQVMAYWGPRRLNHHTEASSMLYAARECARLLVAEGLDAAVARHELHGRAMLAGVRGLGLAVFGDLAHKMTNVVAVEIPDGVAGEAVRSALLEDFGIEIGTSFGPLAGRVWRIGTMGYNAREDAVLTTLAALETVLRRFGTSVPAGGGTDAAASEQIEASNKDYEPWFSPIWEQPGGEVESGLFALQAAIGAGILGFVLGTFRERRKRSTETAPNADDSPQNAARAPESTTRSS